MTSMYSLPSLFFLFLGCAPDIGADVADVHDTGAGLDSVENQGGTTTTTVDATDGESWVYFDFESGALVAITDPESDLSWDLGLQRFSPKINGGVSGSGEMAVALVEGQGFDELTTAPNGDYVTDQADEDGDGIPEYAMGGWYDYDSTTHVLTPADLVYVLQTVEGNYVKLVFEDYYDDAGTSGYPSFTWVFVSAPDGGGSTGNDDTAGEGDSSSDEVPEGEDDASVVCSGEEGLVTTTAEGDGYRTVISSASTSAWSCLSFAEVDQVETGWSMAWQQWNVGLPTGSAGLFIEGQDYAALSAAPAEGWEWNNMSLFSDWYNYDGSTHILTAKDRVYVVMDTSGSYWKVQITSYYDAEDTVHHPTFLWSAIAAPE